MNVVLNVIESDEPDAAMNLRDLIVSFDAATKLPIEIPEIADQIIRLGYPGRILFVPLDSVDPPNLRGATYRLQTKGDPKTESVRETTVIVYNTKLSIPWQRLVCSKELVRIASDDSEAASSAAELEALLGSLVIDDLGKVGAVRDSLTTLRCLPLLFPDSARRIAVEKIREGTRRLEEIADWASLPLEYTAMVVSDDWPRVREAILNTA